MGSIRFSVMAACVACATAAQAQTHVMTDATLSSSNMYFCTAPDGGQLSVWTAPDNTVLAVSGIRENDPLPRFAQGMATRAGGVKNVGYAADRKYRVETHGPAYDPERVLQVGEIRLSCVANNDD